MKHCLECLTVCTHHPSTTIEWVHISPSNGHPGTQHITNSLKRLLVALLNLRHLSICHCLFDLRLSMSPLSCEFTTILVAVDQFSKACKLVSLKGLSKAMDTTMALL